MRPIKTESEFYSQPKSNVVQYAKTGTAISLFLEVCITHLHIIHSCAGSGSSVVRVDFNQIAGHPGNSTFDVRLSGV
ncbi:hypothetical protein DPMN_165749 [Dreissena polymorpha]|uniref:Uncharacterized protein n=1 Tax=Dreissena polymorpha TaxID=45954 RepID=A0A9D4F198_DREPO|nr:hypothetical protein DPMN_165749 [Dreissena polymorpha]